MKAWVVFSGQTDIRWLRWILKPGFRHCFVVLHDGNHWISCDPLASHTEIAVNPLPPDFDLLLWLQGEGHSIMPAPVEICHHKAAPAMFYSCVEAVKRLLGLHQRRIITPWQLHCYLHHLNKDQKKGALSWEV